MLRAARNGDLAFLRSVDMSRLPPARAAAAVETAARAGDLTMLQLLHECGCPWHPDTTWWLASGGNVDCLRYAHAHGCPWHRASLYAAVLSADVTCIEFVHTHVAPPHVELAARLGDLTALKALSADGRQHDWHAAMEDAASEGYCQCLSFAEMQVTKECEVIGDMHPLWSARFHAMSSAAARGRVLVLEYADSCGWLPPRSQDDGVHLTARAARGDELACLRFLYACGCACNAFTMRAAVEKRHFACVAYLHSIGCPYFAGDIAAIARYVLLPLWRDHVRARAIALYWAEAAGRTSYAPDGPGRKRDRAAFEADGFF